MNWKSSSSEILINPAYADLEKKFFHKIVELSCKRLPGHIWVSTSGSSSPKWVGLSKNAVLASAESVNQHLESSSKDVWIHALPDFHVGGLGIWARSYLSGARVKDFKKHHPSKWNATIFYQFTMDSKGTLVSLVPAQLHDLVQQNLPAPPSLRAVLIGGGGLDSDLYFKALYLGWKVLPSYGLTECASQVATAEMDSWRKNIFPSLKVLPHLQVGLISDRLKVKGTSLISLYATTQNNQIEFSDPKKDNWFITEDRVILQGPYLQFQGRIDQMIKIGGESVDFKLLENLFNRIQPDLDKALVAYPDPRLGTVIHMAIEHCSVELAQSIQFEFNKQVLPFERIRKVHFLSKIPRSSLSKILKKQLLLLLN